MKLLLFSYIIGRALGSFSSKMEGTSDTLFLCFSPILALTSCSVIDTTIAVILYLSELS